MQSISKPLNCTELGLYEYLLVANPDALVREKVMAEKKRFDADYQLQVAAKTLPHITIASFAGREAMEETIVRYTQRICSRQHSFEAALNNFSGFPLHSIYLRVQDHQPFRQISKELSVISNYVSSCACPPVTIISNPHINIARHLPETIYLKAMMDYSQKMFYETFMVSELVLLRRGSDYEPYKTLHLFRMQPPDFTPFKNNLFN